MRNAWLYSCVLWSAACAEGPGDGVLDAVPTSPAVSLEALGYGDIDCFIPYRETPPASSDALQQVLTAHRQMLEFKVSYAIQMSQLLTKPIRDNPHADRWREEKGYARLEGAVLAEGEGWWVVKMVATWKDRDGELASVDAEISLTPNKASFDFGASELELRPHLLVLDDYLTGCDDRAGLRFEIGPTLAGAEIVNRPRCWPRPDTEGLDPRVKAELDASFDLQCAQTIEKARLP